MFYMIPLAGDLIERMNLIFLSRVALAFVYRNPFPLLHRITCHHEIPQPGTLLSYEYIPNKITFTSFMYHFTIFLFLSFTFINLPSF